MPYLPIIVCAVLAMVLGFVWYGPLFGKLWMHATGADSADIEKRKEMQRKALPLFITQFALILFQLAILAYYIHGISGISSLKNALWIWAAFVMPTVAGSAMWTADSAKIKWTKFILQAGYQLALFIIFGVVLGMR